MLQHHSCCGFDMIKAPRLQCAAAHTVTGRAFACTWAPQTRQWPSAGQLCANCEKYSDTTKPLYSWGRGLHGLAPTHASRHTACQHPPFDSVQQSAGQPGLRLEAAARTTLCCLPPHCTAQHPASCHLVNLRPHALDAMHGCETSSCATHHQDSPGLFNLLAVRKPSESPASS